MKRIFLIVILFLALLPLTFAQEGQFCEFDKDCPDEVTKWCNVDELACEHFRHFRCENNICTLLIVEERICHGPCPFGCDAGECLPNPDPPICEDQDADGYGNNCDLGLDCDDTKPLVNPGSQELCIDEIDNNCNTIINEFCEGADKFRCSNDDECTSSRELFCNINEQACVSIKSFSCINPGKENSGCVGSGGGQGCRNCEFGCEVGMCLENKFIRGDADGNKIIDLTDPITLLNHLFLGAGELKCQDSADFDDTGVLDITDVVYLLNYLFLGSNLPPPIPYPSIGIDPTEDELSCKV